MSAPTKYSTKSVQQRTAIVNEIIASVKTQIDPKTSTVSTVKIDMWVVGHGLRPFGDNAKDDYIDYTVACGGHEWKGLGKADVSSIGSSLKTALSANAEVVMKDYGSFQFPVGVRIFGKPCAEFKRLVTMAQRRGVELTISTLYNVRLFGKRSTYGESGERDYIAFNPADCQRLKERIKKAKRVKVERIDDIDTKYSSYYETECYGYREVTLTAC